jgi:hypothetical protein
MIILGYTRNTKYYAEVLNQSIIAEEDFPLSDVKNSNEPLFVFGASPILKPIMDECIRCSRDFYSTDSGYIGNVVGPAQKLEAGRKKWLRLVKNGLQHTQMTHYPSDDRLRLIGFEPISFKRGGKVLVVLPGPIAALYHDIKLDTVKEDITKEIRKYTDRKIIFREKDPDGIKAKTYDRFIKRPFWKCLQSGDIHCTISWGSVASVESICYGIPTIALKPCAASPVCDSQLSNIENPKYPSIDEKRDWLRWISKETLTRDEITNKLRDLL